jgi:hypothetical protein
MTRLPGTPEKTWTYEELTSSAVLQIERCTKQAAALAHAGDHTFAQRYAEWAYGVCELWREQTRGHQIASDVHRLESAVRAIARAETI